MKTEYCQAQSYLWGLVKRIAIPNPDGSPYLIRWVLWVPFGLKIYLHKILAGDADRDYHDHPWNFVSLLVWGRYVEETPGGNRSLRSWVNWHRATDAHRVALFTRHGKARPVYTIILRGKRTREWGFRTPEGWIPWKEYNLRKFGQGVI